MNAIMIYASPALDGAPLGKVVAQTAHALCAVVLGSFDFNKNQWKTPLAKSLWQTLDVSCFDIALSSEAPADACVVIEDQGHTVFDKPTITTAAKVDTALLNAISFKPHPHNLQSEVNYRMVLVSDKSKRKSVPKQEFIKRATLAYAKSLAYWLTHIDSLDAEELHALNNWINGSFGKIALSGQLSPNIPSNKLISFEEEGISVFKIASKEALSPYTHTFKLM